MTDLHPLEGMRLVTLRNLIALHDPSEALSASPNNEADFPYGALVYGGEGEGATSSLLSGIMDESATGVTAIDAVADYLKQSGSGIGRAGADVFVNRLMGSWLIWDGSVSEAEMPSPAWRWTQDSLGRAPVTLIDPALANATQEERLRAIEEQTTSDPTWAVQLLPAEDMEGRWVALFNHRSEQIGQKINFAPI